MNSGEENFKKMREYSRVDAFLPYQVRRVSPEELDSLWSRRSSEMASVHIQPLPDLEDTVLNECLRIINAKLDAILDVLTNKKTELFKGKPAPVNISGSGMSFETEERYALGDVLEVCLILPTLGEEVFYLYGEVVKSGEEDRTGCMTSIRFTVIDEDIRDQIVKFVFEKQRRNLRKQKRDGS